LGFLRVCVSGPNHIVVPIPRCNDSVDSVLSDSVTLMLVVVIPLAVLRLAVNVPPYDKNS
jgi:hypothetical protein